MVLLYQEDHAIWKATKMTEDKKVYRVQSNQGRIALGELVEAGSTWTADKPDENRIILTRGVVVPRSTVPQE